MKGELKFLAATSWRGSHRYDNYSPKKLSLLRLLPLSYDRLVRKLLSKGGLDAALRVNAELCFAKGALNRGLHWRSRIILTGLIAAYQGETKRAAAWLAAGIALSRQKVVSHCGTYGFSPDFVEWIVDHQEELGRSEYWEQLFANSPSGVDRERLLMRASTIVYAMGLDKEVALLLPKIRSDALRDWKLILQRRLRSGHPKPDPLFAGTQLWHGGFAHPGEKIVSNIVSRAFTESASAEDLLPDDERQWLTEHDQDFHAYEPEFGTAALAIAEIAMGRAAAATNQLTAATEPHREMIAELDRRRGPSQVFVGGFGWTGSSAVFDTLRGFDGVQEMPGTGEAAFVNDGADSEPMLHQGPAGLRAMSADCISRGGVGLATWRQFLRLYVLFAGHRNYFEYKTVLANRRLLDRLGSKIYFGLVLAFLQEYSSVPDCASDRTVQRVASISRFGNRLIKALFPDDDAVVLFNNSINTDKIDTLSHVPGQAIYISVNRSILDQMADQRRSNIFFHASAATFAYSKRKKLRTFQAGQRALARKEGIQFHDLNFEDWVREPQIRRKVAMSVLGTFDAAQETRYFTPEISAKNVDIYPNYLSRAEIATLRIARLFFPAVR